MCAAGTCGGDGERVFGGCQQHGSVRDKAKLRNQHSSSQADLKPASCGKPRAGLVQGSDMKRSPAKADAKGWRRQTHDFQMAYARWQSRRRLSVRSCQRRWPLLADAVAKVAHRFLLRVWVTRPKN